MNKYFLPTLALAPIVIGTPIYVYTSYQAHQEAEPAREVFCYSDMICEGSADNCREGAAPLYFKRGDDFTGEMRFDNGRLLKGPVTAIAGQATGVFEEQDGTTWDFEFFSTGNFTLMGRVPAAGDRKIETFYQGTCERIN
jgi:hypothetical protein